jgi:hypothetical protein
LRVFNKLVYAALVAFKVGQNVQVFFHRFFVAFKIGLIELLYEFALDIIVFGFY